MTTRILLRSPRSPFESPSPFAVLERNLIGDNVGNLVFLDAAYRILARPDIELAVDGFRLNPRDADRINERYDVYVVPFANAFRRRFERNLERWTDLVERLRIPVVVLGVGAQSNIQLDREHLVPMERQTRRFVSAVLDRSPSIGVRGEFTADWLRGLGFRDVEVIGCPSMFWAGERFHVEKRLPALDADSRIAITISPYRREMGPILMHHHARYPNLTYLPQESATLELLLMGRPTGASDPSTGIPVDLTHPMIREGKVRMFVHPWPWISFLRETDFSFGTRIHGSIASLLAGTPAVLLAHDSRTLELARYFEIPHRLLSEVPPDMDAADLYADADYSSLVGGHPARWRVFSDYLARHGLTHAFAAGGDGGAAFDARVAGLRHEVVVSREMPARPTLGNRLLQARLAGRRRLRDWVRRARARRRGRGGAA